MKGYSDYLFVFSPHENIIGKVRSMKQFCAGMIGSFETLHSKAHITFQPFPRKKPFWIEPIVSKLEKEFSLLPPITLQMNGFGIFTNGDHNTIYGRLKLTPSADEWFKDVRRSLKLKKTEPHITIAKSLTQQEFKRLWPHFGNRDWSDAFVIDKLTILQRETIGHDRGWTKVKDIPFKGNPDTYRLKRTKDVEEITAANSHYGHQVSLF